MTILSFDMAGDLRIPQRLRRFERNFIVPGGTACGSSARHNKILCEPRSGEEHEQRDAPAASSVVTLFILYACDPGTYKGTIL